MGKVNYRNLKKTIWFEDWFEKVSGLKWSFSQILWQFYDYEREKGANWKFTKWIIELNKEIT